MARSAEQLPVDLYTASEVRTVERAAIAEHGLSELRLMRSAADAALKVVMRKWPEQRVVVFCGGGKNGGDGLVLAALLRQRQREVQLSCLCPPENLRGVTADAREFAAAAGLKLSSFDPQSPPPLDRKTLVIDAMLGTGLRSGGLDDPYPAAIAAIRASEALVLALDIPSGLCSDSGNIAQDAVRANCTVTFAGLKRGLFTASGPECCGHVIFADLGLPSEARAAVPPFAQRLVAGISMPDLPARQRGWHKGDCGHVLVIGGNVGMGGAAVLAATAAARSGAGLVSVATHPEHAAAAVAVRPELMIRGIRSGPEIDSMLARATVLVVGPGLGQDGWAEQMLQQALGSGLPLVLDADALRLLPQPYFAAAAATAELPYRVLTPHPGEAAALLACDAAAIQADRYTAVLALRERWQAIAVLKGTGTLIADADGIGLCDSGNPGMASGGMGDVLSGILGGLLAQAPALQIAPAEMVRLGVSLHSRAADHAAHRCGERSMLAMDLLPSLGSLLRTAAADDR